MNQKFAPSQLLVFVQTCTDSARDASSPKLGQRIDSLESAVISKRRRSCLRSHSRFGSFIQNSSSFRSTHQLALFSDCGAPRMVVRAFSLAESAESFDTRNLILHSKHGRVSGNPAQIVWFLYNGWHFEVSTPRGHRLRPLWISLSEFSGAAEHLVGLVFLLLILFYLLFEVAAVLFERLVKILIVNDLFEQQVAILVLTFEFNHQFLVPLNQLQILLV